MTIGASGLPPPKTRDDAEVTILGSTIGAFAYILRSTGESSAKFGPCGVCDKHVSEVYTQTKRESFADDELPGGVGWAVVGPYLFGHRECLMGARR